MKSVKISTNCTVNIKSVHRGFFSSYVVATVSGLTESGNIKYPIKFWANNREFIMVHDTRIFLDILGI